MMESNASARGLLALAGCSTDTLWELLHRARRMEAATSSGDPTLTERLRGKVVAQLFFEPSTRTALSFRTAAEQLGARVLSIGPQGSSVEKGEGLIDTAHTLVALGAQAIVLRHASSGAAAHLARHLSQPIINAGDGMHEHPTQGLLDVYTVLRHRGHIEGLNVVIVGDIQHSRVARSDVYAFRTLGARVRLAGPPGFVEPELAVALGIEHPVIRNLDEALAHADVIIALRVQNERIERHLGAEQGDYVRSWRLGLHHFEALRAAGRQPLLLHPGPVNRGVELTSELASSSICLQHQQAAFGVFVRMAVLDNLLRPADDDEAPVRKGVWADEPIAVPAWTIG